MPRRCDLPSGGLHVVDGLDDEVDLLVGVLLAALDDDLVSGAVHTARRDHDTCKRTLMESAGFKSVVVTAIFSFLPSCHHPQGQY